MKKGFVVSAVLYPLLVIAIALIMSVIAMSDNRRKILDNLKLEVTEESETDPEMSNSTLYYKMLALEEAYAEMNARLSEERFEELKLEIFPVGSLFVSTTNTNPSTYLGGEWKSYGAGRTLVGVGNGTDSNSTSKTFTAGSTGGEYRHTITTTELPSHTHSIPSLTGTTSNGGVHKHNFTYSGSAGSVYDGWMASKVAGSYINMYLGNNSNTNKVGIGEAGLHSHTLTTNASTTGSTGSSSTMNVMQPYITVYFWRRIS